MPTWGYDGSGNFHRRHDWTDDSAASIKILSDRHDEEDDNFAAGLNNVICRDGQTPIQNDIPWNSKRITQLADPVNPQDAATRNYCDTLSGWSTSKNITGADAQGRLNFTSLTGVNGITWTNIDAAWLARPAVTSQSTGKLVFNSKADGTGTDLFWIDKSAIMHSNWWSNLNTEHDGTNFRTVAAGHAMGILQTGQTVSMYATDTATTTDHQIATLRQYSQFTASAGSTVWQMNNGGSGKANVIYGMTGTSVRWAILPGNGAAESGSNAGSDFQINRYNDSGALIDAVFSITRSNGAIGMSGALSVSGVVTGASFEGGNFNSITPNVTRTVFGNYRCKNGISVAGGAYGGNYFNLLWNSAAMVLFVDNTNLGTINTTCDHRTKKDVKPLASMWEKVRQLRPITYSTRHYEQDGTVLAVDDDTPRLGFLAHELQDALGDSAASGRKDEANLLQSPNMMAIIAALTSALQEAMLRIEALEAK